MSLKNVKVLTFDTGGTILDWFTGFKTAFHSNCSKYDKSLDFADLARTFRKKSLSYVVNQDASVKDTINFDQAHLIALNKMIEEGLVPDLSEEEKHAIAYKTPHSLLAWNDFPEILPLIKQKKVCVSFTLLSIKLVIDTARHNNLSWDAIISCESIGKYKPMPEAYKKTAEWLQVKPDECAMVACHNFDLDAAKNVGYKTIFVKRVKEWGEKESPDPTPNPLHDVIVDNFENILNYI